MRRASQAVCWWDGARPTVGASFAPVATDTRDHDEPERHTDRRTPVLVRKFRSLSEVEAHRENDQGRWRRPFDGQLSLC